MTNESKKYYIPLPKNENAPTGYIEFFRDFQFVEVSEDVYRTYYKPIWRTWKYAKRHGTCTGEDWKRCLGDCIGCNHCHHHDNCISLDVVLDDTEETTLGDSIADPSALVDAVLAESATLEELLTTLDNIDPDGRRIGELLIEGKSGREISRLLGIAHTTYLRRFNKLKEGLKDIRKNIF